MLLHVKPPIVGAVAGLAGLARAVAALGRGGAEVETATDVEDAGHDPAGGRRLGVVGGPRDQVTDDVRHDVEGRHEIAPRERLSSASTTRLASPFRT